MTDSIMDPQHPRWSEYVHKLNTSLDMDRDDAEAQLRAILTEMGGLDVEASIASFKSKEVCEDCEHNGRSLPDGVDDIDRILEAVDRAFDCIPIEPIHREGKWRRELETLSPPLIEALAELAEAALRFCDCGDCDHNPDWYEDELAVASALSGSEVLRDAASAIDKGQT